ncbi:MAG: hypothetical protein RI637_02240 [Acidimicrobiia bacterium]|nr:hypothetical protein [Acidimicrobiia bacterium]
MDRTDMVLALTLAPLYVVLVGDAELDTVYESNGRGKKVRSSPLAARSWMVET